MRRAGVQKSRSALLEGPVPSALFNLGWPVLITVALDFSQSVITAVWCGHLIGSDSLAALAVLSPVVTMLGLIAGVVHIGVQVLVARSRGRGDDAAMPMLINAMYMGAAWAIIVTGVGLWQLPALITMLADGLPITADLAAYVPPWLAFYFASVLGGVVTFAVNGTGWTRFGLARSVISIAFMLALMPLFVEVFDLGLAGVSLSDGCSDLLLLVLAAGALHKFRSQFDLGSWKREHWRLDLAVWRRIGAAGVPMQLARAVASITQIAYVRVLANEGSPGVVGAYGLVMLVLGIVVFMPAGALAAATGIMVGQNVGAGNYARARDVLRVAVIWGAVISVVMVVLAPFAGPMFSIFTDDTAMIERAVGILRAVKWAIPGMVIAGILQRAYSGVAKNWYGNLVSIAGSLGALAAVLMLPWAPVERVTTVITVNSIVQLVTIGFIAQRTLRRAAVAAPGTQP